MNSATSATFFCIYSGQELPVEQRSLEHIVPYSLGGPGTFGTDDVSAKANSDMGSAVDLPLINHPFITVHRWRLQLKGQSGVVPGIDFPGTVNVNGRKFSVVYSINSDGTVALKTHPQVKSDWLTRNFYVSCDPKDLPEILENLAKRAVKKGIASGPSDFKVVASNEATEEKVTIETELVIGTFDMVPGFVKMALGTGHLVLGETWSRGPDAERLRSFINAKSEEFRRDVKLRGTIWPNGDGLENSFYKMLFIDNDKHVLIVLNNQPVVFYALLFGRFDATVSLSEKIWAGPELSPGKGIVFVIDSKTRRVVRLGYEDFMTKQMIEKGML